jgi:hypothetical protein
MYNFGIDYVRKIYRIASFQKPHHPANIIAKQNIYGATVIKAKCKVGLLDTKSLRIACMLTHNITDLATSLDPSLQLNDNTFESSYNLLKFLGFSKAVCDVAKMQGHIVAYLAHYDEYYAHSLPSEVQDYIYGKLLPKTPSHWIESLKAEKHFQDALEIRNITDGLKNNRYLIHTNHHINYFDKELRDNYVGYFK